MRWREHGMPRYEIILLGMLLFTCGCGKIGAPLPPFVKIPEAALDLTVEQRAYDLHFGWTNPVVNVDQSASTDVARVLLSDGQEVVARIPSISSGIYQTHILSAKELEGSSVEFTVRFETSGEKVSGPSNTASVAIVAVPGPVRNLAAVLDQGRISLRWDPPSGGDAPVDAYRVYRSGQLIGDEPIVSASIEDTGFQIGVAYEYRVVPLRQTLSGWVEGIAGDPLALTALDRTPPAPPAGLSVTPAGNGVFVTWETSSETDVFYYRVFRRESPVGAFHALESEARTTSAFFDPDYRSGYQYAVSAIDEAGNQSPRSEIVP